MQDTRIRLASAFLLSFAAFASIVGAVAVCIWWLVFTQRQHSLRNGPALLWTLALFILVAHVMTAFGGDGLSYLVRMAVLLLVGAWLFTDYRSGDFLAAGTWLGGNRIGFELGMIAEMALQMAEELLEDISRIRTAMRLKGQAWGIRSLVPAGRVLLNDALVRADTLAEQLAMRGYRNGGTICPVFYTTKWDVAAGAAAAVALIAAFIPVSEFFILYR